MRKTVRTLAVAVLAGALLLSIMGVAFAQGSHPVRAPNVETAAGQLSHARKVVALHLAIQKRWYTRHVALANRQIAKLNAEIAAFEASSSTVATDARAAIASATAGLADAASGETMCAADYQAAHDATSAAGVRAGGRIAHADAVVVLRLFAHIEAFIGRAFESLEGFIGTD
jgi:hypothetical protein